MWSPTSTLNCCGTVKINKNIQISLRAKEPSYIHDTTMPSQPCQEKQVTCCRLGSAWEWFRGAKSAPQCEPMADVRCVHGLLNCTWGFPWPWGYHGVPQARWMVRENLIEMDDHWGLPPGNHHLVALCLSFFCYQDLPRVPPKSFKIRLISQFPHEDGVFLGEPPILGVVFVSPRNYVDMSHR